MCVKGLIVPNSQSTFNYKDLKTPLFSVFKKFINVASLFGVSLRAQRLF